MIDHNAYLRFCLNMQPDQIRAELTNMETKVFNMIRVGYPIDTVAERLKVTRGTIENYRWDIKKKGYDC